MVRALARCPPVLLLPMPGRVRARGGQVPTEIRRRTEPGTRGSPGGCYGPLVKQTNHKRHLVSACFALGSCAGCSNMPVRSLPRTRRRRRATGRVTKRGIRQERRPSLARRVGIAHSPQRSDSAAQRRSRAIRLAVRLVRETAPKGARMFTANDMTPTCKAQSSQLAPSLAARHLQGGSRGAPISRTCSKRPPTVARSPKHGELYVAFRNDVACVEHETLQPKPLKSRIPVRENGTVDRNSASVGRWGVFMW